jgi:hypothetical protein
MSYIIGIAGIPEALFDQVERRRDMITGENAILFAKPLRQVRSYSAAYASAYVEHFAEQVAQDRHNDLRVVQFGVICIQHDTESTRRFRNALFPSVIVSSMPWDRWDGYGIQLKKLGNDLAVALQSRVRGLKRALNSLQREMRDRVQRTPFLLPIRNFRSSSLLPALSQVNDEIVGRADCDEFIRSTAEEFERRHPPHRDERNKLNVFTDDQETHYRSPGRDLHGLAHLSAGHPRHCLLAGRRRLGVYYSPGFHYDCMRENQARLRGLFFSCHENETNWEGDPHLNIAPNDFVRK